MNSKFISAIAAIGIAALSSAVSSGVGSAHDQTFGSTPQKDSMSVTPKIYGGTPATGNPGVAALAINTGSSWNSSCSAAVWKPRILLTAAHCVTVTGGTSNVARIAVFPPGATAVQYTNTGPQGASAAQVIQILKPATYINASTRVEPNDFAILVLNTDVGPSFFSRLGTSAEMSRWSGALYPGTVMGYGLTGPNQRTTIPIQAQVPIDTYEPLSSIGPIFSVGQSASVGVCSGDSGGPTYATNAAGERLLLGVNSGSAGGCEAGFAGNYLMVGFAAIDYLDLMNQALTTAGYPTIPSAPVVSSLVAVNNTVVVSWGVPQVSPGSVSSYEVLRDDGSVACSTTQLACTVTDLAAGEYEFTVRALNSQAEGNAATATLSATVVPPSQMAAPRAVGKTIRFRTLAGSTSAVVNQYRVIDARGKRICTVKKFSPNSQQLTCPVPAAPGSYRFRVLAVTEMGTTVPSGLSGKVVIS